MSEEKKAVIGEELYRYPNFEQFKKALAKAPPASLLKTRGLGGSKQTTYQPIEVTEALADMLFRTWDIADEKYFNILNEISCTVKIVALPDYPDADYMTFTGSASKPIQVDKDSKVENFPVGKKANALQYNMPAVRSDAIGNAFEKKGNIFGRNVGRDGVSVDFGFDVSYERPE